MMELQTRTDQLIRVLLVECSPEGIHSLEGLARDEGPVRLEVRQASSSDQAIEFLSGGGVDVVLLDVSLPDDVAFEALELLHGRFPEIPIVALTESGNESQAMRALEKGAQDYAVKRCLKCWPLVPILRRAMGRTRAERTQFESQKLHRTVLNSAMDAIFIIDDMWHIQEANPSAEKMFGAPRANLLGRDLLEMAIPPSMRERYRRGMNHYLRNGSGSLIGARTESTAIVADGSEIEVEFSVTVIQQDGHPMFCVSARDIGELKEMERKLEYERNLLRALIDSVPDHIYAKDLNGRFLVANAALVRFFGAASSAEVIGRTDADFFPPKAADSFSWEEQQILRTGQPLLNREAPRHRDPGSEQWILTTKVPLLDHANRIIGIVGVNHDITQHKRDQELLSRSNVALADREKQLLAALNDLKRSHEQMRVIQQQLVEADKMELVGRLAAGVAHEVKNPLAIIAMAIDYLALHRAPANWEEFPAVLRRINHAVQRADVVIRGLLDFSAPRKLNTQLSSLNAIVEQSYLLVKHEIVRSHIRWRTELESDLPDICVDVMKIEQVFVNLFMNAIHAMPKSGTLTVRTRAPNATGPARMAGERLTDRLHRTDRIVVAEVEDTGVGIPEEQIPKVFDPFFTTKPTGQGTGLGLTVAKAIVDQHGGIIEIRNRKEGGVVVTVSFTV